MKLSSIKLAASVITDLYKNKLVEEKTPAPAPKKSVKTKVEDGPETTLPPVHIAENKKKNILVFVSYPLAEILPEEELVFLTNMLTACKLSLADVAIINLAHKPTPSFKEIAGQLSKPTALLFGTAPSILELPVDFPHFQVQS